ncbi:hypothetical protein F4804DRAFT_318408 [Jackrogersella minutella]|nr:hypothetical protein F4804DRAFT_318408 [Jackrogersella minutella]
MGLGQLKTLPPEIWQIILQYSESYPFWRFVSALDFTSRVSWMPSEATTSIAVSRIAFWGRGNPPEIIIDLTAHPIIRLTIDSHGIAKVERLPSYPSFSETRFDDLAFVIEDQSYFTDAIARFKVYNSTRPGFKTILLVLSANTSNK